MFREHVYCRIKCITRKWLAWGHWRGLLNLSHDVQRGSQRTSATRSLFRANLKGIGSSTRQFSFGWNDVYTFYYSEYDTGTVHTIILWCSVSRSLRIESCFIPARQNNPIPVIARPGSFLIAQDLLGIKSKSNQSIRLVFV